MTRDQIEATVKQLNPNYTERDLQNACDYVMCLEILMVNKIIELQKGK